MEHLLNKLKRVRILLLPLLLLFLFALLNGCVAAPPNVPVCVALDMYSGFCVDTIDSKEGPVTGPEWEKMKENSLVMPADSWAQIKIYILEMCKLNTNCAEQLPVIEEKINRLTY